MYRWMNAQIDHGWMYRQMDGWMDDVQMDGWMDGWMDEWVHGWMDGWMDGQMDGRMGVRMDGWMDMQQHFSYKSSGETRNNIRGLHLIKTIFPAFGLPMLSQHQNVLFL